jgi:cytochrome b6-f complex iron-sulfur subunit
VYIPPQKPPRIEKSPDRRKREASHEYSQASPEHDAQQKAKDLEMSRRRMLTLIGWGGVLASMGGSAFGAFRFMFPEVLYEPPTIFKIGKPTDDGMGVTDTLKKERQIWVVRNERGLYVLVAICRHLGCTPNWFLDQQRFRCPCHGSIYDIYGNVRGGPAPRTLWRAAISLDSVDGRSLLYKASELIATSTDQI